jgi:DNA polymerase-3 subunit alpha
LIKPAKLVEHYAGIGVNAACITDNANMCGVIQLYNACKKYDIKPIIGMEVNLTPARELKRQQFVTVVLLAKNVVGFYNLIKIATVGSMYFYYVPRVDIDVLKQYRDGLVALSSDLRGIGAIRFFESGQVGLVKVHEEFMDIFHQDFYWELQPTQTESQRVYNEALLDLGQSDEHKLVVSGDPHYLLKADVDLHRAMLASRNFRNAGWEYPFKGEFHVLNEEEMVSLFTLLHGYPLSTKRQFLKSFEAPWQIAEMVEQFDLRRGTKVPSYQE